MDIYEKNRAAIHGKNIAYFRYSCVVCMPDEQEHFSLCLNVDSDTGLTVIAETCKQMLEDMEQCRIPMETVFRKAEKGELILAWYNKDENKIEFKVENAKEIPADMLPVRGAFLS